MRLFIPEIGTRLRLVSDWTFDLKLEGRNDGLWNVLECEKRPEVAALQKKINESYSKGSDYKLTAAERETHWSWWLDHRYPWASVTLPAGTVIHVDRIYIRKGAQDYSSLTFNLAGSPDKRFNLKAQGGTWPKGRSRRFFASLDDVNRIEFEHVTG